MKIDHLVILASDLARSAAFYDTVLTAAGFTKTRDHVWLDEGGVAVDLRPAASHSTYDRHGAGLNHFGIAAPDADTVRTIARQLAQQGVAVPGIQIIDGATCLFLPDPDGLRVEISHEPAA